MSLANVTAAADLAIPAAIHDAFRLSGAPHSLVAMGTDTGGNVYLAGRFVGAVPFVGFPVATKTILGNPAGYPGLFIAKISPSGDRLLHLTEIRDSNAEYD